MIGGRQIGIPSSIAIVMVVVGEGVALDPVAAMTQVDTRSFKALVAEPREKSRDAKEQQQKDFQDMDGKVIVE